MANPHWNTPVWLVELVRKCGCIDLDPCSNPTSIIHARHEYGNCPEVPGNGLYVKWEEFGLAYINMPFDDILPWTRKAARVRAKMVRNPHSQIIAVVPADRTETAAWKPIWDTADVIALTKKRVRWDAPGRQLDTTRGSTGVIYWGLREKVFIDVFRDMCRIITEWQ